MNKGYLKKVERHSSELQLHTISERGLAHPPGSQNRLCHVNITLHQEAAPGTAVD